jgi:hypothetical protein
MSGILNYSQDISKKKDIQSFVDSIRNVKWTDLMHLNLKELYEKRDEFNQKQKLFNGIRYGNDNTKSTLVQDLLTYKGTLSSILKDAINGDTNYTKVSLRISLKDVDKDDNVKSDVIDEILDKNLDYYIYDDSKLDFIELGKYENTTKRLTNRKVEDGPNNTYYVMVPEYYHKFEKQSDRDYIDDSSYYIKKTPNSGGKRKTKKTNTIRKVRHNRRKNRKTIIKKRKN